MKKRIQFRRRRANKTDYRARLEMLKAEKPRLVTRLTNRRAIAQLVESAPQGDVTITQADSKELERFGWKWRKNTSAAYLVGVMLAKRAIARGKAEAIFDAGLRTPIRGGRLAAILKGALDGGLQIPHNPEILPKDERIAGKDADAFKKIKEQLMAEAPQKVVAAVKPKATKARAKKA